MEEVWLKRMTQADEVRLKWRNCIFSININTKRVSSERGVFQAEEACFKRLRRVSREGQAREVGEAFQAEQARFE